MGSALCYLSRCDLRRRQNKVSSSSNDEGTTTILEELLLNVQFLRFSLKEFLLLHEIMHLRHRASEGGKEKKSVRSRYYQGVERGMEKNSHYYYYYIFRFLPPFSRNGGTVG